MNKHVPRVIGEDETLVRAVLSPMHFDFKKKRLKPNSFYPSKKDGGGGVSCYRLAYTNQNFCKAHAKSLMYGQYIGLFVFPKNVLIELAQKIVAEFSEEAFTPTVIATPLDESGEYIPPDKDVYTDTPGLPMHAEVVFDNFSGWPDGEPYPQAIRKFANSLVNMLINSFYIDPKPELLEWEGPELF
jgi:hypothetical protein